MSTLNTIVWKTAAGCLPWDWLVFGCSHTSGIPFRDYQVAPGASRSILECGLEGNDLQGINNMFQSLFVQGGRLAQLKPKLVVIEPGFVNGSMMVNQASWQSVADMQDMITGMVEACWSAGAAVMLETSPAPAEGYDAMYSYANIKAYNDGLRALHDVLYYNNKGRFAVCETAGSMSVDGLHSLDVCVQDGIHPTPAIQWQRVMVWWLFTFNQYQLQV